MFFFIFASYNIFYWIHLLCRISVVLSGITYCLFSRFYLMFVMVFTTTLVRILCGGIYRHFSTFYFAFAEAFTAALVCIFSGGIYRHFSQFYSFSAAVFSAALASCLKYYIAFYIFLAVSTITSGNEIWSFQQYATAILPNLIFYSCFCTLPTARAWIY